MSKVLSLTPDLIAESKREFERYLSANALIDGKLNFMKEFESPHKHATVWFTGEAWCKMVMLLQEFDKEIAWHGVASRVESEDTDEYLISDIMVYPQTVTGTTVDMDPGEYAKWIMDNVTDDRFFNIHMQGHSHVRMGVTPSPTDLDHQAEIVTQLGPDDFYIFMIYNKSYQSNIKIYDKSKNTLFENGDVEVKLQGGAVSFEAFIKDAKEQVKEKYVTPYNNGGYQGVGSYQNQPPRAPVTPASGEKKSDTTWANDKPKSSINDGWKIGANGEQLTFPAGEERELFGE